MILLNPFLFLNYVLTVSIWWLQIVIYNIHVFGVIKSTYLYIYAKLDTYMYICAYTYISEKVILSNSFISLCGIDNIYERSSIY